MRMWRMRGKILGENRFRVRFLSLSWNLIGHNGVVVWSKLFIISIGLHHLIEHWIRFCRSHCAIFFEFFEIPLHCIGVMNCQNSGIWFMMFREFPSFLFRFCFYFEFHDTAFNNPLGDEVNVKMAIRINDMAIVRQSFLHGFIRWLHSFTSNRYKYWFIYCSIYHWLKKCFSIQTLSFGSVCVRTVE